MCAYVTCVSVCKPLIVSPSVGLKLMQFSFSIYRHPIHYAVVHIYNELAYDSIPMQPEMPKLEQAVVCELHMHVVLREGLVIRAVPALG